MKNPLDLLRGTHKPDPVALSEYMDERATPDQRASIETHVASCAACRAWLVETTAMRSALRAMPEVDAPRSFRLRQSDVEVAPRTSASPGWLRAMPALAAASIVVFALVLGTDLATRDSGSGFGLTSASAPRESAGTSVEDTQKSMRSAQENGGTAPQPASPSGPAAAEGGTVAGDASGDSASGGSTLNGPTPSAAADNATDAPPQAFAPITTPSPAPSPDRDQVRAASEPSNSSDDGNQPAFRIVEIVAAVLAVAAGAAALATRRRSREASS